MDASDLPPFKKAIEIIKVAAKEFQADSGSRMGAALSYYTIFSLVPLMFLLVAVAGFVFEDERLVDDLLDQVTEVAGPDVGAILDDLIQTVGEQRTGALSIGVLLAAYLASGIFQQLQAVLAVIFKVPQEERRQGAVGWLIRRGTAVLSASVFAILAFTPIVAVAAVGWIEQPVAGVPELVALVRLGVPITSVLVLMAVVAASLQLLTKVDVPWKAAIRGGAGTAIVGLLAAFGVGQYLSRAGSSGTLGALGGLAVLLFFFNLIWMVYIGGAEVTAVYADYLRHGDIVPSAVRDERRSDERYDRLAAMTPERRRLQEAGVLADTGIFAFLTGLLIGFLARVRR